jgi:hypothetical protein
MMMTCKGRGAKHFWSLQQYYPEFTRGTEENHKPRLRVKPMNAQYSPATFNCPYVVLAYPYFTVINQFTVAQAVELKIFNSGN